MTSDQPPDELWNLLNVYLRFEAVNVFHSVTSNRLKQPIQGRGFYWNQKCPRWPQVLIAYKGAVVFRHRHSSRNNSTIQQYLTCAKLNDEHGKWSGSRQQQIHSVSWRKKDFGNSFTDELRVPGFRVNSLYSPVSQAPNTVALDLEVIAANFGGCYSEAGTLLLNTALATVQRLHPHARRRHFHWLRSIACQPITVGPVGGCASSQWEDGRPADC